MDIKLQVVYITWGCYFRGDITWFSNYLMLLQMSKVRHLFFLCFICLGCFLFSRTRRRSVRHFNLSWMFQGRCCIVMFKFRWMCWIFCLYIGSSSWCGCPCCSALRRDWAGLWRRQWPGTGTPLPSLFIIFFKFFEFFDALFLSFFMQVLEYKLKLHLGTGFDGPSHTFLVSLGWSLWFLLPCFFLSSSPLFRLIFFF